MYPVCNKTASAPLLLLQGLSCERPAPTCCNYL